MYEQMYQQKLSSADNAVNIIAKNCNISFGMAVSQPPALLEAIGKRAKAGDFDSLKVYYLHAEKPANEFLLQYDLMNVIKPCPGFIGAKERELIKMGDKENRKVIFYVPNSFSHLPRYFRHYIELDTFVVTVSPMDNSGNFSFGTNNDYTSSAARLAKKVIVEVNENMPRVFGDSDIHISEVDAIVENHTPLLEFCPRPPSDQSRNIARYCSELIPDGATIQMGVGSVPDAVCSYIKDRKDLGIHSELLSPGMVELIKEGCVTGRRKKINKRRHVFTLAMGNKAMYDFMDDNPTIESYPVDYVNNPSVIAKNNDVISINTIIEIDLFGQVNAEQINNRQYGGPGGQNDFVRGAFLSNGGKSILAFESTTKGNTISKIVPKINNIVTDLRIDTHYVCTEYGIVNLMGLTSSERTEQIINLAHPDFRHSLTEAAKAMHFI
ncbi:acetyl-CoA hydrolase/transferase family protein [Microbulbifer sp. GL-2]|uniref:acetyl-CoA hydrolase/transferase family protein n=1 Tax=Microbulbifer sp. GL-2 TaxID=2591606 RepID=UPI001164DB6F|nr:acetyl-CoA hydrolase/transferase C-terminal domain-containing protein [Microbulbifer sp. GL-2]BBM02828.1 4-hydroxybutyrate CoA-transferase [Microbulbifer sp. GL-2]